MFKYQQLALLLNEQINQGDLPSGASLPSLRQFSRLHGVSLSTAMQAYSWLEQQGWIIAKPQSGYYVREKKLSVFPSPKPSAITVTEDKSELIFDILQHALNNDSSGLSSGVLDNSFRPKQALQRALNRNARREASQSNGYGHNQGEAALRLAIAEQMRHRHCLIDAENILITNGCLEAVVLAIEETTKQNDVIAVFSPCYSGLLMALQYANRQILEIPCGPQGPDLDYLQTLFEQNSFSALLLSATATNPIGFTLSAVEKQRLANLATCYKTWLIEDDTFGSLNFLDKNPNPIFAYDQSGYVVYCSSFSKDLASNFRIGWLSTRNDIIPFNKRKMALNLTCSTPCQLAMADYLLHSSYSNHIRKLRANLRIETHRMQQAVLQHFPEGTQLSSPDGGFFLWVQLPGNVSAMQLYRLARKKKIYIMPGEIFTMTKLYKNNLRLSANKPWDNQREKEIKWLGKCAKKLIIS